MCPPCEHEQRVKELEKQIELLKAELLKYKELPKDSSNSGIPPSQDQNRRHYPKRERSGKLAGGQLGHAGHNHPMSETPDTVVDCPPPETCPHCGSQDLEALEESPQITQEVDVPEVKPQVTEYRQHKARCRRCRKVLTGQLPKELYGPVQIGGRAESLASYLKASHALSNERVAKVFQDVLGLKVSEGWVENTLTKQAEHFSPTYEAIRQEVRKSQVAASDETGVRIDGKKGVVWIFQIQAFVYFTTAFSRGFQVIQNTIGDYFHGTWVSDRYGAQLKLPTDFNQFCLAHIIRECRWLEQASQCAWAIQLKAILVQAIDFRRNQGDTYQPNACKEAVQHLEQQLAQCFAHGPPEQKKAATLFNGLRCHQDKLLRFLHDPRVPPTNNDSERPLRHWALLKKVFGGFRTLPGVHRYDILLSIIQSAKRQNLNILDVLSGRQQLNFSSRA